MIVLVMKLNYKCYWDVVLVHVFLIDGHMVTIEEEPDDG